MLTSFDPGIQEESAVRQMVRQHAKGMKASGFLVQLVVLYSIRREASVKE